MLAAVYLVSISVETDNDTPYLRVHWENPKTGEKKASAMLRLGELYAEENNRIINNLADQILCEHLEEVHAVQGVCEAGMKGG